jgi:D-aspartate ligase
MNARAEIHDNCITANTSAAPGVLLVGGAVGTLAAARSLGRQGVTVWFLTGDSVLPSLSRYVTRTLNWKGAHTDTAVDELVALAKQYGLEGWVLIPGGDKEVRLLAKNHARLSTYFRLTTQPWDVIQWADDKNLTYQLAERVGLDVPKRYLPTSLDEVRQLDCRFPVILKPASHKNSNPFTLAKAWIAEDRATLVARYKQAADAVDQTEIVLQEMIPGVGTAQFSYAAVWHKGQPLAALVATRSRQYPINVGYTSTFVEVVENSIVTEAATRFLSELNYSGAVEIEFKFDARDGAYKILDVNPRLWAWIGIGDTAGINFAYILYRSTLGEMVPRPVARVDAAWMHLTRDFVAAFQELLVGRLTTNRYLSSYRKKVTFATFAIDDPLPMIAELPITLYRVLTRRAYIALSEWFTRSAQRGQ